MSHRVSVIVPVWNMARFLPDAIASIPDVHEIIIVAAESNDNTFEVAQALAKQRRGVRVLPSPKKRPASARNIGLSAASGDVIAFNDADDVWPQGKLALQLKRLDGDEPQPDVVTGLVTWFKELDRDRLAPAEHSSVETKNVQQIGAAIFRRSVFDRIGLFDESLMYAEDWDLLLRIIEAQVPFVVLNTPTLYYRRHGDSMMARNDPRIKSDLAKAFAMSLARRRKLGLSLAPVSVDRYLEGPSI
jgi:glycosyltransferase involved in cell wall biosynthesis